MAKKKSFYTKRQTKNTIRLEEFLKQRNEQRNNIKPDQSKLSGDSK